MRIRGCGRCEKYQVPSPTYSVGWENSRMSARWLWVASLPLQTPPGKTQRLWSGPENPQLPNCPVLRNNQKPQPLPKKEKERKPQEHSKSMSNSFAPWNKTHCGCTQSGRRLDKEEARSHLTRRFLVVSKTELSSIKTLLLLGCWGGAAPPPLHTNLKTKDKPRWGGEAWGLLLLPCTLPKCLNARRSRPQSWQLSVIIPATPRAPAPGSMSRAGERHLPGSDEMPVSVPAAASRPCRPRGGTASLPGLGQAFFSLPRGRGLSHYLAFITEGKLF